MKDSHPDDTIGLSKEGIEEKYKKFHDKFEELQEKFYASKKYVLLIVLQGIDCSGKDGTVRKALSGINPSGFYVENFRVSTPLEPNYGYLWRVHQRTPRRGDIVVSNRLYYEDVLVTCMHRTIDDKTVHSRLDKIREFEEYLINNDTILFKFFLHISKDLQQRELEERLETPEKNQKFSAANLEGRCSWDEYQYCYSDVLSHCSTREAPWYVVPANHRWFHNYLVLSVIVKTLRELSLEFPAINGDVRGLIKEVKNSRWFQAATEATRLCLQRGYVLSL